MGTDKAFVEIEGRPLALLVAEAVSEVAPQVSLVGDPARYNRLGLPVVADRFPGCGPLAGIEAALSRTDADWNLIVACDMPALDAAALEALFGNGDVVLPEYESGNLEPLCAVYHRRCHPAILHALQRGVRRVTEALRNSVPPLAIRYVRVRNSEPFANLNTPAELAAYKQARHG
jgi:molybdopterin-guanine dinucleotide biosynthesis protein A